MSNKRPGLLFCILLIVSIFSATAGQSQNLSFLSDSVSYLWPTNASPYLSSTFAETRSAHLHSGLDIRTWGREGYEVYATRDGEIYRIGIGPDSYGKVIYLRHKDQSFSVYAHLQKFNSELQAFADSIRMQDYSFELDHHLNDQKFSYKKGDVLGYTGSTGVGPPHLHFELRTPDFKPFNPLLTNLSVSDDIPPIINSLAIENLHSESLHFRGYEILQPLSEQDDQVDFGTVQIDSPIGLAINVHDRANRTSNYYAVYELIVKADQDTLFHSRTNQFGFDEGSMMFLDRSYPILAQTRRGYQRLFVVNGNQLPLYLTRKNSGILGLKKGEQHITIIAKDIYGNSRTAKLTVISEKDTGLNTVDHVPAYPYHPFSEIDRIRRNFSHSARKAPYYSFTGTVSKSAGPDLNVEKNHNFGSENSSDPGANHLIPGKNQVLTSTQNKAWLEIPSNSLFDTLSITMDYDTHSSLPVVRFSPNRLPVNESMQLTMLLPDDIANDPAIGLYSYDEYRDRYTFLNSKIKNGVLKTRIREFAELRIKRDETSPWIGRPEIVDNIYSHPVVHVPVADRESGINYGRSDIRVNGERGIIEYDKDKKILIFYHPSFEPIAGENLIDIELYDRTGNRSKQAVPISYSKQK